MANQVSPKPEFAEQDYSKEGVLQTLLRVSQSDLRDCRTICYLLSTYHFESTEPVRLSDHYSLQLYPIRAGSLHPNLQTPIKPLDTNLLYKVTLRFETPNNNSYSEDIFQGLLIGRLMKDGEATHYVVFLTSEYQLYACLSGSLSKFEESPYRSDFIDDEVYDESDDEYSDGYHNFYDPEKKFINDKRVFEFPSGPEAPKVVYCGALEAVMRNRSNKMPKVIEDVKEWACHGYVDGAADKNFKNDAQLAHSCRDSLLARSTFASGSSGSFGSGGGSGGSGSSKAKIPSQSTISLPPDDHEKWGFERAGRTWVGYVIHRLKRM
ncbi:hypothetical protein ACEPPN_003284 [Leptodophora sp. 'Broadleaf-Isolate-01']